VEKEGIQQKKEEKSMLRLRILSMSMILNYLYSSPTETEHSLNNTFYKKILTQYL